MSLHPVASPSCSPAPSVEPPDRQGLFLPAPTRLLSSGDGHGRGHPGTRHAPGSRGAAPDPPPPSNTLLGSWPPILNHSRMRDQPPPPKDWAASRLLPALGCHLPFQVQPLQRQPVGLGWQEMRRPVGRTSAQSSARHPKPRHGGGGG